MPVQASQLTKICSDYFVVRDIPNIDPTYELYMKVDKIEATTEGFALYLDGMLKNFFIEQNNLAFNLAQDFERLVTYSLVINYVEAVEGELKFFKKVRSTIDKEAANESSWYFVQLTNIQNDIPASLFIDNVVNPQENKVFVNSITKISINSRESAELTEFIALNQRASRFDIINALNRNMPENDDIFHLSIYHVGQGNLSAICGSNNVPFVYFDVGGGWRFNHATYPTPLSLSFSNCDVIIISHWDWDHLETARRAYYNGWNSFRNKIWVAPKQNLSPSYSKFAAHLASTGQLVYWPNNLQFITFWGGVLYKCTGNDKNNSGIALLLNSPNSTIKQVLHPADASYNNIPSVGTFALNGLVATHHGSSYKIDFNALLSGIAPNAIGYAYGADNNCQITNTYGHPKVLAQTSHVGKLFTYRKNTCSGNIAFKNTATNTMPAGEPTDLSIVNIF